MIGQIELLNGIKSLIDDNRFPKFTILCGQKGSGKRTLCQEISSMLGANPVLLTDTKVETLRGVIVDSYKNTSKTLYIIADADLMSLSAKNSILKVTEEPPNNAYFIMTLQNINNTLNTIRSRGMVIEMQDYTPQELKQFSSSVPDFLIKDLCETPGEVQYLNSIGADDFYNYVCKVIDNIAVVSGANAFKIANDIRLKDGAEGYDLKIFWKVFKLICWKRYLTNKDEKYLKGIDITSQVLRKCENKSINKQMLFDTWILDIRQEWFE